MLNPHCLLCLVLKVIFYHDDYLRTIQEIWEGRISQLAWARPRRSSREPPEQHYQYVILDDICNEKGVRWWWWLYAPPEGYLECDHHVILQGLSDSIVPANVCGAVYWFHFFVLMELDGKRGERRSHLSKEMQHKWSVETVDAWTSMLFQKSHLIVTMRMVMKNWSCCWCT